MLSMLLIAAAVTQPAELDASSVERFASLALDCVHIEYPNKIGHVMNSDEDVRPPRELTPAFYGCFDWHSSVHGHWLLARLLRTFPDASFAIELSIERSRRRTSRAKPHTCRARDARASNALMDWRGFCNSTRSWMGGRTRTRVVGPRPSRHSSTLP